MKKLSGSLAKSALSLAALALASCAWKKGRDQVKAENKTLDEEKRRAQRRARCGQRRDREMQTTLNDVQKILKDLHVKELKAVRNARSPVSQESGTCYRTERDELKTEIKEIRNAVKANLAKLADLQKQEHASDMKATSSSDSSADCAAPRGEGSHDRPLEEKTQELTKTTEELRSAVKEKEAVVKGEEGRHRRSRDADVDRLRPHSDTEVAEEGRPGREEGHHTGPRREVGRGTGQFDETSSSRSTHARGQSSPWAPPQQGAGTLGYPKDGSRCDDRSEGEHTGQDGWRPDIEAPKVLVVVLPD